MRVLLLKPNSGTDSVVPPLGLGYLATALRPRHEVAIVDAHAAALSPEQVARRVARWAPDLVGIQVYSSDRDTVQAYLSRLASSRPRPVLVLGGPHPSSAPEEVLRELPDADFAIRGEAEGPFRELVDQLEEGTLDREAAAGVAGLIWRDASRIQCNESSFALDLDGYGEPAWDLLRPERYPHAPFAAFVRQFPVAPIIASRGCPRRCTFCAAGYLSGHRIRYRAPEAIVDEIQRLQRDHGIREIQFADDNLAADPRVVQELCELLIRRGVRLPWSCPNGVRVERLSPSLLSLMRRAGCYSLAVGVESGSRRILELVRKDSDLDRIRQALQMMREAGILSVGYFVLGFPGESDAERQLTMELAVALPLDRAHFMLYCPLPGTPLYEEARRTGRFVPAGSYSFNSVIHVPEGTTARRLALAQKEAFLRFYLRPRQLGLLLGGVRDVGHLAHVAGRIYRWLLRAPQGAGLTGPGA